MGIQGKLRSAVLAPLTSQFHNQILYFYLLLLRILNRCMQASLCSSSWRQRPPLFRPLSNNPPLHLLPQPNSPAGSTATNRIANSTKNGKNNKPFSNSAEPPRPNGTPISNRSNNAAPKPPNNKNKCGAGSANSIKRAKIPWMNGKSGVNRDKFPISKTNMGIPKRWEAFPCPCRE